jgi:NhaA family Na+:H+ antiporter
MDRVLTPFEEFLKIDARGGILLLAATVAALAWVNSPWSDTYKDLWQTKKTIRPHSSLGYRPPEPETIMPRLQLDVIPR